MLLSFPLKEVTNDHQWLQCIYKDRDSIEKLYMLSICSTFQNPKFFSLHFFKFSLLPFSCCISICWFFFVFVYREEVTSFLPLLLVIAPWLVMVFHACNTIRKHDFSKGSTWLKYSHWPRGMVVLTKVWGMKDTSHFWLKHLTKMTFLIMWQSKHLVKKLRGSSRWSRLS
jgi:hypothetical protein